MKSARLFLASSLAVAFVSCANQKNDYDTQRPVTTQPATAVNVPGQPANPTYDTPPAYQESGTAPVNPDGVAPSALTTSGRPAATLVEPGHGATVYTVVANDNLTRIANKFKVSIAAIKKANNMTNDTVVLGKKMIIPAH
ncbi:MAG: LysM peptidoglycan-binding domain-containing protein [Verrucomicrobiota bacterium]